MNLCKTVGKYFIIGCAGITFFSACRSKPFKVGADSMENTIKKNSTVYYAQDEVKRNDIVIFQYVNKVRKHDSRGIMRVVGMPGDSGFYLFYLDANGEVQTDTYHDTLDGAFKQARFEFGVTEEEWEVLK